MQWREGCMQLREGCAAVALLLCASGVRAATQREGGVHLA